MTSKEARRVRDQMRAAGNAVPTIAEIKRRAREQRKVDAKKPEEPKT